MRISEKVTLKRDDKKAWFPNVQNNFSHFSNSGSKALTDLKFGQTNVKHKMLNFLAEALKPGSVWTYNILWTFHRKENNYDLRKRAKSLNLKWRSLCIVNRQHFLQLGCFESILSWIEENALRFGATVGLLFFFLVSSWLFWERVLQSFWFQNLCCLRQRFSKTWLSFKQKRSRYQDLADFALK